MALGGRELAGRAGVVHRSVVLRTVRNSYSHHVHTDSISVPFSIPEAFGGLAECHGILRSGADGLELEFQSKDGFFGVVKSAVRTVSMAWEDLGGVEFKAGWFSARVCLTARSLKTFDKVPGARASQIDLAVARQHRPTARELTSFASMRLCERELRRMAQSLENHGETPR